MRPKLWLLLQATAEFSWGQQDDSDPQRGMHSGTTLKSNFVLNNFVLVQLVLSFTADTY